MLASPGTSKVSKTSSSHKERRPRKGCHPSVEARLKPLEVLKGILMRTVHHLPPEVGSVNVVEGYLRNDDWPRVYSWAAALKQQKYTSAYTHFVGKQLAALVLKYPVDHRVFGLDKSPKDAAIDLFFQNEERCRRTNRRFRKTENLWSSRFWPLLEDMRQFCHLFFEGIGCGTQKHWAQAGAFGSGSNVGIHGESTHPVRKISSPKWTCTEPAIPLFIESVWNENFHVVHHVLAQDNGGDSSRPVCLDKARFAVLMRERLQPIAWNKIDFVPKTAEISRSIAIEPTALTYLQKGVDLGMRDGLRRWGYDLTNQERNQRLAKIGSITGEFATMDLSSASALQARELVRFLLPAGAYDYLNRIRSPGWKLPDGRSGQYEMFVSMGNGFCFPLETLIFAAAARATMRSIRGKVTEHAVYGDDIIVPGDCFEALSALLNFCGFTLNPKKSFSEGPFRESCGADWYHGLDVRPVEVDRELLREVDLMILHNSTLRSEWTREFFEDAREWLRTWSHGIAGSTHPSGSGWWILASYMGLGFDSVDVSTTSRSETRTGDLWSPPTCS